MSHMSSTIDESGLKDITQLIIIKISRVLFWNVNYF